MYKKILTENEKRSTNFIFESLEANAKGKKEKVKPELSLEWIKRIQNDFGEKKETNE